jgi:hypothetical protein
MSLKQQKHILKARNIIMDILIGIYVILALTACSNKEIEVKHVYVKDKIFISEELTNKQEKVEVPVISDELNKDDIFKIKDYIFKLYVQNKYYETNLKIIKEIVDNFNKDNNTSISK